VRESAEHELGARERGVFRSYIRDVPTGNARGQPPLFVRGCERQLEPWMAMDKRTELAANVAAGPENSHWYFIHIQCIIMQLAVVNRLRN
jgi:hypothetical protein